VIPILLLTSLRTAPCVLWTALPDLDIAAVASPGDVNGNGTDDLAAVAFSVGAGGLWCVDGRTGATLWFSDLPGVSGADCLCGAPDLNGDLVGDVVAGTCDGPTPGRGRILAISGADGTVIWETDTDPDCTICAVASSPGPPGELPVIHASVLVDVWLTFLTLDGADGDTLWSITHATLDYGIHTMADFSGNGWGEMGYSVDRGSVTSGFCRVHDGRTGDILYQTGTMYYGRMALTDSPGPIIAVGQFGFEPELRAAFVSTGTPIYQLDSDGYASWNLRFVNGIQEGTLPSPVLIGWEAGEMNLICGITGIVGDKYVFPSNLVGMAPFQTGICEWELAVLAGETFHAVVPSLDAPDTGPSCPLPAMLGKDLCLMPSDCYPTPLAGIALSGSGPGLCSIVTSWPEGIEGEENPLTDPWIRLLANPGCGGIHLQVGRGSGRAVVLDITGREVAGIEPGEAGNTFLRLPPGVYLVIDGQNGELLFRAVVTGRRDS
jgi:outer membrane protein assembly factor BamB